MNKERIAAPAARLTQLAGVHRIRGGFERFFLKPLPRYAIPQQVKDEYEPLEIPVYGKVHLVAVSKRNPKFTVCGRFFERRWLPHWSSRMCNKCVGKVLDKLYGEQA